MDGSYPDVAGWRVKIIKREFNQNGFWLDKIEDQIEIYGINYFKIPGEYFVETASEEYMYTVEAFDENGDQIGEEPEKSLIGDGTAWIVGEYWYCNGPTFAFGIQQFRHPNGGLYNYSFTGAADYFDENMGLFGGYVPYYEYMYYGSWYNHHFSGEWLDYHLIEETDYPADLGTTPQNHVINAPDGGTYRNSESELLDPTLGTIVGVQKTQGPWLNASGSQALAITSDWSVFDLDGVISRFNSYSNLSDFVNSSEANLHVDNYLFCPQSNGGSFNQSAHNWSSECFEILPNPVIFPDDDYDEDGDADQYDNQQLFADCQGFNWADIQEFLVVAHRDEVPVVVAQFKYADLHDNEDNIVMPTFNLNQGMYSTTTTYNDGTFQTYYFSLEDRMTNTCPLSSFLEATIFPVPLTSNNYSIHLVSTSKLKFIYEVLDTNGNILYTTKFDIAANHNQNHTIESLTIPSGIQIHRFTFADGSVKTIETSK